MLLKGKYCKCNKRHTVHSYITSAQTSLGLFVYKKKKKSMHDSLYWAL